MQVDAENLMLGAGVAPDSARGHAAARSLHLRRDVVDQLPRRPAACRSPWSMPAGRRCSAALAATDGFNQVEAPLGCLIVFSTGAGKPAIAPAVETLNTFYTGSLVKLLGRRRRDLVFRLVPAGQARRHADDAEPSGAGDPPVRPDPLHRREHAGEVPPVAPAGGPTGGAQVSGRDEAAAWKELEASLWPADIVKLAEAYLQSFPPAACRRRAGGARGRRRRRQGAAQQRGQPLPQRLPAADPEARWLAEWRKAARGDKDAAARIARAHLRGDGDIAADPNRYEGWLQYAAALGNGIACYELAVYYRRQGQPTPAAQYETRARELGYTPPTSLDNQRK